jgi:hypothetical protein
MTSTLRTAAAILLLAFPVAIARSQQAKPLEHHTTAAGDSNNPTGRWITTHISQGGIGNWWDFRSDGTVVLYIGAAVTTPVTHTDKTLTVPDGGPGHTTLELMYTITRNQLNLKRAGDRDTMFTRDGQPTDPKDPLLGRWRPNPPATYSENASLASRQKAMTQGVYIFKADNTQTVRVPFLSRNGTWSSATHTFHMDGEKNDLKFERTKDGLTIGLPPDGTRTDTIVHDTAFSE